MALTDPRNRIFDLNTMVDPRADILNSRIATANKSYGDVQSMLEAYGVRTQEDALAVIRKMDIELAKSYYDKLDRPLKSSVTANVAATTSKKVLLLL
jgi:hypothetical protein